MATPNDRPPPYYDYDALLWFHEDNRGVANEMLKYLEGKQVVTYFEPRDGGPGKYTLSQHAEVIRKSRYIFLLISNSTRECGTFEFKMHLSLENSLKKRLQNVIPVLLDPSIEVPAILDCLAPLKNDEFMKQKLTRLFDEN